MLREDLIAELKKEQDQLTESRRRYKLAVKNNIDAKEIHRRHSDITFRINSIQVIVRKISNFDRNPYSSR